MKHTESEYIQAGYDFARGRIQADILRLMIESEQISGRAEARRLIDQGRTEAKLTNTQGKPWVFSRQGTPWI